MIALIYLGLAVARLFVSSVDRAQRKQIFIFRLGVFMFAVFLTPEAQMLALSMGANKLLGALVEVMFVIVVGEHLILHDLNKRGALPTHSPRVPLGV